jgi:FkbM family methyltransferase
MFVGVVMWLTYPSRLPPRRGLLGSPIARALITVQLRNGLRLRARIVELQAFLEIFFDGAYEQDAIPWDEVHSIVDVGANAGVATIWFAGRAPLATVLAIEPSPSVLPLLTANVTRNGLGNRVRVLAMALGSAPGSARVERAESSLVMRTSVAKESGPNVVPVLTLAQALENYDEVDVLKLDIEGSEYDVLLTAEEYVIRKIRVLVCEHHEVVGHKSFEIVDRLRSLGFRVAERTGSWQGNRPEGLLCAVRQDVLARRWMPIQSANL